MNFRDIAIYLTGGLIGISGLFVLDRWIPELSFFLEQGIGVSAAFARVGLWIIGGVLLWRTASSAMGWLDAKLYPEEHSGLVSNAQFEGWSYISPAPLSVLAIQDTVSGRSLNSGNLEGASMVLFKTFRCQFVDNGKYAISLNIDAEAGAPYYEDEDGNVSLAFTITEKDGSGSVLFNVGVDRVSPDDTSELEITLSDEQVASLEAEIRADMRDEQQTGDEHWLSEEDLVITEISVEPIGNVKVLMFRARALETFELVKIYLTVDGVSYWAVFEVPRDEGYAFVDFLENFYRSISIEQMGYLGQLSIMQPGFLNGH